MLFYDLSLFSDVVVDRGFLVLIAKEVIELRSLSNDII